MADSEGNRSDGQTNHEAIQRLFNPGPIKVNS